MSSTSFAANPVAKLWPAGDLAALKARCKPAMPARQMVCSGVKAGIAFASHVAPGALAAVAASGSGASSSAAAGSSSAAASDAGASTIDGGLGDDDGEDLDIREIGVDTSDYYTLLGLGHRKYDVTERELKVAYRRAVMQFHPDKNKKIKGGEEAKEFFLTLEKAYNTLKDPEKKRGHDSGIDIEGLEAPSKADSSGLTAEEFIELWEPVFTSNARFSERTPVPSIGTPETPYAEVKKFYIFWENFESWRNFAFEDERETGAHDDRRDVRNKEKQNKIERKKKKKKEMQRITKFVSLAKKLDPRMAKAAKKGKSDKAAEKKAAAAAAAAAAEQEKKDKEAAAAAAAAAAEQEKKDKKARKKAEAKARRNLRNALNEGVQAAYAEKGKDWTWSSVAEGLTDLEEDVAFICKEVGVEGMADLTAAFSDDGATPLTALERVGKEISRWRKMGEADKEAAAAEAAEAREKKVRYFATA